MTGHQLPPQRHRLGAPRIVLFALISTWLLPTSTPAQDQDRPTVRVVPASGADGTIVTLERFNIAADIPQSLNPPTTIQVLLTTPDGDTAMVPLRVERAENGVVSYRTSQALMWRPEGVFSSEDAVTGLGALDDGESAHG